MGGQYTYCGTLINYRINSIAINYSGFLLFGRIIQYISDEGTIGPRLKFELWFNI